MKRTMAALLAWLAILVAPSQADARCIRLTSEHFVFVGDAGEGTIRTIAERLELFYEVISRIFYNGVTPSPVPTVVVVFQNARSFAPARHSMENRSRWPGTSPRGTTSITSPSMRSRIAKHTV